MADLIELPLREIRRQLMAGELNSVEIASFCIARRKKYERCMNALHLWNDDSFLASSKQADSLIQSGHSTDLTGIPMSVKSVIGVDGYPCYAGCKKPLPAKWGKDAAFVAALRKKGVTISSVSHAAELSIGGLGVNEHYSTPRNPWDVNCHRVPGGSSSGAAISLWEGAAKFALGTDTGGSVRVPASASGVVGLKTTTGRWPIDGIVPLASRFDSVGVFALSVDDLQFIFDTVDQQDDENIFSRIEQLSLQDINFQRCSAHAWNALDPGIEETIETVLDQLCSCGMQLQSSDSGIFTRADQLRQRGPNTAAYECNKLLMRDFPEIKHTLSLHVREFLKGGENIEPSAISARIKLIGELRSTVHRALSPVDVLISPTLKHTPPTLHCVADREQFLFYSDELLANTVLASINGLCALTLPVGLDDAGMPVGLQLSAKAGAERYLLKAAQLIETRIGTCLELLGTPPCLRACEGL